MNNKYFTLEVEGEILTDIFGENLRFTSRKNALNHAEDYELSNYDIVPQF